MKRSLWVWIFVAFIPATSYAAVFQANPSNYRNILESLKPGDTLVLQEGTYEAGLPVIDLHGTADMPIVITGPEKGKGVAILTGRPCCNTVQIKNSSYVEIKNLRIDGKNIAWIDGVNARGVTHHITIADLHIVGHGYDKSTVGISTKGPAWNWVIRGNIIDGAGTGMYLGDSTGSEPFVAGLIERNLVINTIGYNLQIKHQKSRPPGIGMPETDSRTIIRDNVFSKGENSSRGEMSRPNLLVGHFPLSGPGVNDIYEIYGNFFYQNPSEALFQGEGNIAFYGNLLVNDHGDAVNIQPHNDVPRNIHVFRNTIVARDSGIRVTGGAPGFPQKVFANAVFAGTPINAPEKYGNITSSYSSSGNFLVDPSAPLGKLNLFPRSGMLTGDELDFTLVQAFTDSNMDFDGRAFLSTHRGAYVDDGAGPAWMPVLQIKPSSHGSISIPDGGSSGGGSAGGGGKLLTVVSTLLEGLEVFDGTNVSDWSVEVDFQAGDLMYGDRPYLVTTIPSELLGLEWIRPANDSKVFSGSELARFRAKVSLKVYVAHRDDIVVKPSWLSGWVDTGMDVVNDEPRTYSVYEKEFGAGETVVLGANGDVSAGMYVVLLSGVSSPGGGGSELDSDGDGLPDAWEESYFGDLTTAGRDSDSDGDGLLDREEQALGTDPTRVDTDGDGDGDLAEFRGGSDPTLGSDRLEDHAPRVPLLGFLGGELPVRAYFAGASYEDPDGDELGGSEWEIVRAGDGLVVFRRELSGRGDLMVPLGVLLPGESYRVRVRHWDARGVRSGWSAYRDFVTSGFDARDADGDGTDDRYQVGLDVDSDGNGVLDTEEPEACGLRDVRGGGVVGLRLSGGRLSCLGVMEAEELPEGVGLGRDELPHGMFSFRVEGLEVDEADPAEVSVTVRLPEALESGMKWYKYDEASGGLSDYSGNVTVSGNMVIVRLVDGGDGDADGVVNGVIVDPSGPVTAVGVDQIASAGDGGAMSTPEAGGNSSGGGGTLGLLSCMALLAGYGVRRTCLRIMAGRHMKSGCGSAR